MQTVAFIFPGQGSQAVGMGRALAEAYAESREVFEAADEALGEPLSRLVFEGPAESLELTANTQPAILTVSIAALRALERRGPTPALVAGHSLGEYSALVAAGALEFAEAVRLVRARGRYMQEAVPVGKGAMAAVVGLGADEVAAACEEAAGGETVSPANLNAPDQTVIAGDAEAVERAGEACRRRGARRVVRLPVSAPFHCALMEPAARRLAPDLREASLREARVPVVTNVDAAPVRSADAIRDALARQVTAPVRWADCVRRLVAEGAGLLIEVGPGRVLAGLAKRIDRSVPVAGVEDPASLEEALGAMQRQPQDAGRERT